MIDRTEIEKRKYIAAFDGLRAIAIISIVGHQMMAYRIPGGFLGLNIFLLSTLSVISYRALPGFIVFTIPSQKHMPHKVSIPSNNKNYSNKVPYLVLTSD